MVTDGQNYSSKLLGASSCTACPADSDTRGQSGALTCTSCAKGTSSFGKGDPCTSCPAGSQYYSPGLIDGTLGDLVGVLVGSDLLPASCRYCPAGASAVSGGNCAYCPAGTYAPTIGSGSCTPAPAGSFVASSGATSSTKCPVSPREV